MSRDYSSRTLRKPLEEISRGRDHSEKRNSSKTKSQVVSNIKKFFKFILSGGDINEFGNISMGSSGTDEFGNIQFSGSSSTRTKKRKNRDPLFLNNKKDNVGNLQTDQPFVDGMGMLYTLFKKIEDEDELEEQLSKFRKTEDLIREEERHADLIKALQKISQTKKKKPSKEKPTATKETTKPEKVPTPKKPPQPPKAPGPGKGPGFIPKAIVAGAGIMSVSKAIGATESGVKGEDRYNIAFGDRIEKGKMKNVAGVPTAEQFSGKKLTEMTLKEVKEFQLARNHKVKNTGAVGAYGFVFSTLWGKKGRGGGLVDQAGLSENDLFNKDNQDKLQSQLISGNVGRLKKLGVPLTPGNLYMAHYVGADGAKAVYDAANQNKDINVRQAIISAGLPDPGAQNQELNSIKVKDFESVLASRLVKRGGLTQESLNLQQETQTNSVSERVSEGTSMLKDGIKKLIDFTKQVNISQEVKTIVDGGVSIYQMTNSQSDASAYKEVQ